MSCSSASTLKPIASVPVLPPLPGITPAAQQALKLWAQQVLSQIQAAAGVTGVNVIPQQYALIAGSTLPPIASSSNCSVSLDTSTTLFGSGSYKITITGTPATVTFAADTAWPLHPNWQWLVSFFQSASAAIAGKLTVTTSGGTAYSTDFTTTTGSLATGRLYDALNLGADASSAFGLSVTFTGGSGETVWLDGLMMEPYFGRTVQPSPFISTSGALTLDNNPDGTYAKILASRTSGNVAYNYRGVWTSTTTYVTGDETVYGASYWLAIAPSTNSAPATGNSNWQVIGSYSGFEGAWNSITTYYPGAEVTNSGNFWVCLAQNTGSAPAAGNANWQIAGPASAADISYTDGSTVESLQPAEAGADVTSAHTSNDTANVSGVASATVSQGAGRANAAIDSTNVVVASGLDFSRSYTNKTLTNIPDGTGRFAVVNGANLNGASAVDSGNNPRIDFSQSFHLNKNLANIADGASRFAVTNGAGLGGIASTALSGSLPITPLSTFFTGISVSPDGTGVAVTNLVSTASPRSAFVYSANAYYGDAHLLCVVDPGVGGKLDFLIDFGASVGATLPVGYIFQLTTEASQSGGIGTVTGGTVNWLAVTPNNLSALTGPQTIEMHYWAATGRLEFWWNGILCASALSLPPYAPATHPWQIGVGYEATSGQVIRNFSLAQKTPLPNNFLDASNRIDTIEGAVSPLGSIVTGSVSNTVSYASTTNSVTISWTGGTINRMDGTQTTVPANTTGVTVTGLTASTTYYAAMYWDEVANAVDFVTGEAGAVGSPAILYPSESVVVGWQMNLQNRLNLGWIPVATPASGAGGGNGSTGCCLRGSQLIELASGVMREAQELTAGDVLTAPDGPIRITQLRFEPWAEWYRVEFNDGRILEVAPDHRFMDPSGVQIHARDLKLQTIVQARNCYLSVARLELCTDRDIKVGIEVEDPHVYFVDGVLSHNKVLC